MSYSLSFSPEFFLGEGEPYDASELCLNSKGKPTSVWSAIHLMFEQRPKEWAAMAEEVFDLPRKDAKLLMVEAVLERIQKTNTCSNLGSPVEVWIDRKGEYRLKVWDGR